MLGFVVPGTSLMMPSYREFRRLLLEQTLRHVVLCGDRAFQAARVPACILIVEKTPPLPNHRVQIWSQGTEGQFTRLRTLSPARVQHDPDLRIRAALSEEVEELLERVAQRGVPLQTAAHVEDGINPGPFRKRLVRRTPVESAEKRNGGSGKRSLRLIEGRDFTRYSGPHWSGRYILWAPEQLKQWQRTKPNSVAVLGSLERFTVPEKILTRQTADGLVGTLDRNGYCCTNSVHTTRLRTSHGELGIAFLLGVLNSRLIGFYYRHWFGEKGKLFPQVKVRNLRQVPIPQIDLCCPKDVKARDELAGAVEELLSLNARRKANPAENAQNDALRRRAEQLEHHVDRIVYDLFALSEEDIALVEQEEG